MSEDIDRRLKSMFSRGVVRHLDLVAGLAMPQAEFWSGELRRVEMPQGYGFASSPQVGFEVFAAFANGQRGDGIAVAFDDGRYRGKATFLMPGDAALYGPNIGAANGHQVHMTNSPKPGTVKIKASRIELRGGQFYVVLDEDPTIGAQKGTWDPTQELPLNPHGAAL